MMKRRTFIKSASMAGAATILTGEGLAQGIAGVVTAKSAQARGPIILSTWNFGHEVPEMANQTLQNGGSVIDAVERAVMIPEADPKVTSVGYGGYPDRDGHVTLDACSHGR